MAEDFFEYKKRRAYTARTLSASLSKNENTLKGLERIVPPEATRPFIAALSHAAGKKARERIKNMS
jgi:hypothetical protein